MVAAQRIGEEYELKIDKAPQNVDSALTQGPEMARVRELMYWNLDNTARSEWANLVKSKSKTEQAQLARYAFNNQWWDLSVQATIAGKLWDHLKSDSRWLTTIFQTLHQWEGDPAKLCDGDCPSGERLESKVKSPVGASGLMQIMPGTATHTVKMFSIPGYSSPGQLLDRKQTSTLAPVTCNMFISSLVITVFSPQQLITPDQDGCEPGLATAPGVSTQWHLSRVFRSPRRAVM